MNDDNFLKQLLLIGVGTTSLVAEKLKEVTENWVESGRLDPTQASALIEDLMTQFKTEQENIEVQLQRQLRIILQDIGVPRQAEMDELRGRLDRLERQLRDLENRLWK
jgi:polyhydroxyalkanoate synthesis regulator phasin